MGANKAQAKMLFEAALVDLEVAGAEVIRINLGQEGMSLLDSAKMIGRSMLNYSRPDFAAGLSMYMNSTVSYGTHRALSRGFWSVAQDDPGEFSSDNDLLGIQGIVENDTPADSLKAWEGYREAVGYPERYS